MQVSEAADQGADVVLGELAGRLLTVRAGGAGKYGRALGFDLAGPFGDGLGVHFYAGDPAGAREWVARHRDIGGINYMALETCFGDMTKEEALQSAELLATEVMPRFA